MERIIVSRHASAIQFIARTLWGEGNYAVQEDAGKPVAVVRLDFGNPEFPEGQGVEEIPVLAQVKAEDVQGKVVYGNLPLHLASLAHHTVAVEFSGDPPRGQEYSLEDMLAAGAYLQAYYVTRKPDGARRCAEDWWGWLPKPSEPSKGVRHAVWNYADGDRSFEAILASDLSDQITPLRITFYEGDHLPEILVGQKVMLAGVEGFIDAEGSVDLPQDKLREACQAGYYPNLMVGLNAWIRE